MSDFAIKDFKQVSSRYIDIDYYEVELENENIRIEINFQPIYIADGHIQVFVHVGYIIAYEQEEDLDVLYADFTTDVTLNKDDIESLRGKKKGVKKEKFVLILSEIISMMRGYFICQMKGTTLGDFYLPMIDTDEIVRASEHIYAKNKVILLEE